MADTSKAPNNTQNLEKKTLEELNLNSLPTQIELQKMVFKSYS